jgi:hypothetical protein
VVENDDAGFGDRSAAGEGAVSAPRWLELIALTAVCGLTVTGVSGLVLALVGAYSPWITLAAGLVGTVGAAVALSRALPARTSSRSDIAAACLVLVLAAGFGLFAGLQPSQNVLVDRDPGSYTNTARSLVRDGTLETDARGEAFADVPGLTFTSQAVYDVDPKLAIDGVAEPSGHVEFQFNHLTSVLLATGYAVGGSAVMFRLTALAVALGLVLVYLVAVRATRNAWAALIAPTLLAVGAPFLYVARNTYSEPFTLIPLWGALVVLTAMHRRPRIELAVIGGALLGATVCARIDAVLYLALTIPLVGISIVTAPKDLMRSRVRAWTVAVAAGGIPVAIGTFDLYRRSGTYVTDLSDQLHLLYVGSAAVLIVTIVSAAAWRGWPGLRSFAARFQHPAGIVAAGLVGAGLLAGWLIRPRVQTGRLKSPIAYVAELQQRDGLPVDPLASYAEDTLRWMAWYIGAPALVVAIAAIAWLTYRTLQARVEPAALATLVLCLGAGGLYWWNPSITPDQLWASRRFMPAVFPALTVMTSVGLAVACAWLTRFDRGRTLPIVQGAFLSGAAIAMVVPPGLVMGHVRGHGMQRGFTRPLEQTCDQLPDNAAVLVVGKEPGLILQQGVRSWCGVPTAAEAAPLTPEEVAGMASIVRENGYELYVVGQARDEVAMRVGSDELVSASVPATNSRNAVAVLNRPPWAYGGPYTFQLFYAPTDPAG